MEEAYEIEKIVKHRSIGNKVEYLVNWKGYGHKHNTWQAENTMDASELLKDYWAKKTPKTPNTPKQTAHKKSLIAPRTEQKKPATPARTARASAASRTTRKPASSSTRLQAPQASQTNTRKRPSSAVTTNTTTPTTTVTPQKKKPEIKRPRVVPAVDDEPISITSSPSSSSGSNRPFSPLPVISDRSIERRQLTINTNPKTVKENDIIIISPTTATSSQNIPTNIIHFDGQDIQVSRDFRQDWKNWDTEVNKIEKAKIRGSHGEYLFYLVIRWNDGTLSVHDSKDVLAKCPLKVLKFYEDQIASCYF